MGQNTIPPAFSCSEREREREGEAERERMGGCTQHQSSRGNQKKKKVGKGGTCSLLPVQRTHQHP